MLIQIIGLLLSLLGLIFDIIGVFKLYYLKMASLKRVMQNPIQRGNIYDSPRVSQDLNDLIKDINVNIDLTNKENYEIEGKTIKWFRLIMFGFFLQFLGVIFSSFIFTPYESPHPSSEKHTTCKYK